MAAHSVFGELTEYCPLGLKPPLHIYDWQGNLLNNISPLGCLLLAIVEPSMLLVGQFRVLKAPLSISALI